MGLGRALLAATCLLAPHATQAQPVARREAASWREVKCERYREAWTRAVARSGGAGLSAEFIAANAAFMASGCTDGGRVCPRSAAEFALADVLTIAAMNTGAASTFLPFGCPRS